MKNYSLIAALAGIVLDSYNNTLYGFFAVSLACLFFPAHSFSVPIIACFATFAAGYVTRPLGGLVFGYIGDKFGRRLSLQLTILFTAIPTFTIGILPTYEVIGVYAPLILLICRLLQGFSTGSDYTGVIIYVAEQRGINNRVFVMCFLVACGFFGALLGIGISFLLTTSMSPTWGWRLSFIAGGIISLIVYALRLKMKESPWFEETEKNLKKSENPLIVVLKEDKRKLLACCIFGGANLVPVYIATVYLNAELKGILGFSMPQILINNFCILFLGAILVLGSAKIITRFGENFVLKCSLYWFILFSIPVYYWSIHIKTAFSLILLQTFIIIGDAPQIAALAIFLPKIFPPNRRYSGIGFSYALGQALLGGTTPLMAAFLIQITGYLWAPSYLLCLTSFFCLISVWAMQNILLSRDCDNL